MLQSCPSQSLHPSESPGDLVKCELARPPTLMLLVQQIWGLRPKNCHFQVPKGCYQSRNRPWGINAIEFSEHFLTLAILIPTFP